MRERNMASTFIGAWHRPVVLAGSLALVALPAAAQQETPAANPLLPHDLSPWGMFLAADIVVQAVMVGLVFASILTWTILLAKWIEIAAARRKVAVALRTIGASRGLEEAALKLQRRRGPAALLVRAALEEGRMAGPALELAGPAGLKERVTARLGRIQAQAARRLSRGTGILATIGSTAPFVGLFGTVWGIMNAFIGISEAQTTNLAVVAPGIAEALLATALGLAAAIPAVVIYNLFARSIGGYRQMLADAATGVEVLLSRDLDNRHLAEAAAPLVPPPPAETPRKPGRKAGS